MTGRKGSFDPDHRASYKKPRSDRRAMHGTKTTRGCIYCDEAVEYVFKGAGVCEDHLSRWMKATGWTRNRALARKPLWNLLSAGGKQE